MRHYDRYTYQLEHAKEVAILRAHNAPLILGFLQKEFREPGKLHIPLVDLIQPLDSYLKQLKALYPDKQYRKNAREYFKEWEQEGYILIQHLEDDQIPEVEISTSMEKVFQFLEDLASETFVGTESRFLALLENLKKVVYESMEDRSALLRELKSQRKELNKRIADIESGREEGRMDKRQIREYYNTAKKEARHLLGEFKQVEHNFKAIKQDIQHKHLIERESRGEIVAYTLDAEEGLTQSEQGASFEAFWDFVRTPSRKDEFRKIVDHLYTLKEITHQEEEEYFRTYIHKLNNAASKVLRSNRRMIEQLRRILDEETVTENRRVASLIEEITRLAISKTIQNSGKGFFSLDLKPEIALPLERKLWKPETPVKFELIERSMEQDGTLDEAVSLLTQQIPLDTLRLRENIQTMFRHKSEVSLPEILDNFPVESGLAELVAYVIIAKESEQNEINPDTRVEVTIRMCDPRGIPQDNFRAVEIPTVIFRV